MKKERKNERKKKIKKNKKEVINTNMRMGRKERKMDMK